MAVERTRRATEPQSAHAGRGRGQGSGPQRARGGPAAWLQQAAGNRAVAHLLAATGPTPVVARQEADAQEIPLLSVENAALLSLLCHDRVEDIAPLLRRYVEDDRYGQDLHDAYWGFATLGRQTAVRDGQNRRSTPQELDRLEHLVGLWSRVRERITSDHAATARSTLARSQAQALALQVHLVFAYRQAILAGQDPAEIDLTGSDKSLKFVAEQVVSLLSAINTVQAADVGRDIAPLVQVLDKTLTVVNVFSDWQQTGPLMSPISADIRALRNAWTAGTGATSLLGISQYLPLFSHIPMCLEHIQGAFDTISRHAQAENRVWWQLRDTFGGDRLYRPNAEVGGQPLHTYLLGVFRASSAEAVPRPSETVVEFFDDRRDMFDTVERDVMGQGWDTIPTERSWIVLEAVDPGRLNRWVHRNRETVWRLLYGPDMELP